jgi:hypothetical protein
VGSKSPKYLWILSRTPELSLDITDMVLMEAEARGYDIANLIWVDQSENIPTSTSGMKLIEVWSRIYNSRISSSVSASLSRYNPT